ncbi:MAG: nuclear transport factor 2 family protein [Chloroflexota bacterium]
MTNREIIDKYFELASAGKWDEWCDLFSADMVYQEQLAGRIEGRETMRPMMAGFPDAYKSFNNLPQHVFVSGDEGAAVSHISARAMKYPDEPIEAEAMLYLHFKDGKIVFAQNFHDSKPFAPFLRQISGG